MFSLVSLGHYRVRDFDDPVELFQVAEPDLPTEFPPLRVLPADRHNIVPPPTSIVGRDADLETLSALLDRSRLITVVGPGGLGKTRLVMEYGLRSAKRWEHGVWFVDLASIFDPGLIASTFAEAVGAVVENAGDAWVAALQHLSERRTLVIMDNCEHLKTDVGRRIDQLLRACAGVKVLATSREPIGLRSERVCATRATRRRRQRSQPLLRSSRPLR